jgi:hypothetical protein
MVKNYYQSRCATLYTFLSVMVRVVVFVVAKWLNG